VSVHECVYMVNQEIYVKMHNLMLTELHI